MNVTGRCEDVETGATREFSSLDSSSRARSLIEHSFTFDIHLELYSKGQTKQKPNRLKK